MEIKGVALSGSGGERKVSVFIGQAQFGTCRVHLKDPSSNTKGKASRRR